MWPLFFISFISVLTTCAANVDVFSGWTWIYFFASINSEAQHVSSISVTQLPNFYTIFSKWFCRHILSSVDTSVLYSETSM